MGFVAAISPSTFDMGKASYTDVSCGALQLTAKNERRRYFCRKVSTFQHKLHFRFLGTKIGRQT